MPRGIYARNQDRTKRNDHRQFKVKESTPIEIASTENGNGGRKILEKEIAMLTQLCKDQQAELLSLYRDFYKTK